MIDLEFVERLIRTLDESGLDHVEIERGGTRVRVSRSPPIRSDENELESSTPASESAAGEGSRGSAETPDESEAGSGAEDGGVSLLEVTSPMVGTFFRAASPGGDPFTEVGGQVSPGDVLCIIEAMKLMNELEAETGGVIQEICVADGDPVEYGQVLFRVQPP